MKKILPIILAVLICTAGIAESQSANFDWGFNVNGDSYCYDGLDCTYDIIGSSGGLGGICGLPSNIDHSGIDLIDLGNLFATGLGTATVTVAGEGQHFVIFFTDQDLGSNGRDDNGTPVQSPASGQMWEIDEPGVGESGVGVEADIDGNCGSDPGSTYYGDMIQFNFVIDGVLDERVFYDNVDDQCLATDGDTAMAIGWDFELAADETAAIMFTVSGTAIPSGFHLEQTDSLNANYLSSSLTITETKIDDLIIDFGAFYGIWVRNDDGTWSNLHGLNPEIITVGDVDGNGDDDLIIDFKVPGNNSLNGIWIRYDDGMWQHIHGLSAEAIAVGDVDGNTMNDLIVDFGAAYGMWVRYDSGSWEMLHGLNPEIITVGDVDCNGDDDLIIDFKVPGNNSLNGIWVRYDDGTWQHIHGLNAEAIAVGDVDGNTIDDLIIDFGALYGMWVRYDSGSWSNLHGLDPEIVTVGDVDCNGNDDLIIDFGDSYGIWVRYDSGTWNNLHGLNPQILTAGDIDGNGCDDLITDFKAPGNNSLNGIWVRYDDGSWSHLHGLSCESIAVGDVD